MDRGRTRGIADGRYLELVLELVASERELEGAERALAGTVEVMLSRVILITPLPHGTHVAAIAHAGALPCRRGGVDEERLVAELQLDELRLESTWWPPPQASPRSCLLVLMAASGCCMFVRSPSTARVLALVAGGRIMARTAD